MKNSPYEYYADLLAEWPTALAAASQWYLVFDFSSVPVLSNNLESNLRLKEYVAGRAGWAIDQSVTRELTDWKLHSNNSFKSGCVFARQVDLPSESFEANNNVGLKYGGFTSPAVASDRAPYNKLSVTFLETNASFLDFVIRPWIVLASHYGLVAREEASEKYIKARNCDVCFLARVGPNRDPIIRKIYRFVNVVPVIVQGEQYSYKSDDLKYSTVDFVYDQMYVRDADTRSII